MKLLTVFWLPILVFEAVSVVAKLVIFLDYFWERQYEVLQSPSHDYS